MAYSKAPDPFRQAVRNGLTLTYTVDATRSGQPVASGLAPSGGSITDTSKPGVRRVLNLELAGDQATYNLLAPVGTRLTVTAHTSVNSVPLADIPMGVFDIDQATLSEGGGKVTCTAPDKWVKIKRAKFMGPAVSSPTMLVTDQIAVLIRGGLGQSEPVVNLSTSTATMGVQTWPEDREQAIIDLATSVGVWVFFDRNGTATIADIPTIGSSANWLMDASPSGVLVSLDRTKSRTSTCNVVMVESTASAGESFPTQFVWDSDPTSPTYAGPNPVANPELAGPFGVSVYSYSTSLPLSSDEARVLGESILAKTVGIASQISATQVPNPAVDAFDVIDVLPPRSRYDVPRVVERHVVDTVTHSLDVTAAQQIAGRSTRTDPYT